MRLRGLCTDDALVRFPFAESARAEGRSSKNLQIYFIDVEGGQSTLVITPGRQSLLIDTGWAGDGSGFRPGNPQAARDANRILAAARDAGISRIDYLLITHFHSDHDGGARELSQLMPIRVFIDHGTPSSEAERASPETQEAFRVYETVRGTHRHLEPHPGNHLPLTDVDAVVVSSAGATLKRPMAGAGGTKEVCGATTTAPRDPYENPRSTGVVIKYGKFRFLDLGDLTGQPLFDLVCPRNLIGAVDAYLVVHHGGPDVMVSETFAAFAPRVAIMNNGVVKGGARVTYQALHAVSGLEDVWQLDASSDAGEANFQPTNIANLEPSTAYWIKLVAQQDGCKRLINRRAERRPGLISAAKRQTALA
jgi:beta-lactamase superfamily II metal-dependent hydrolase